jgi:hypothetical protein
VEPPKLYRLVGWAALGGVIWRGSPRCFYSEVFNGGGWGWVGGCGDVGAGVMCFAFQGAIYSQAFGRGAGVFCAGIVIIIL